MASSQKLGRPFGLAAQSADHHHDLPDLLPVHLDARPREHGDGWLSHVTAGRIGPSCRPTASLLEAGSNTQTALQTARHIRNARAIAGGAK
ncbi:hypothetical protein [Aurantiacibacter gangjinensis]|uniref:hypothetical protein n=1 Tax=Aurantiacibacter gangjinensis TaxID=502682 RepID=UPI0012E07849|nr:hypothetical protein [Aurantiacibacter gangjinensis]